MKHLSASLFLLALPLLARAQNSPGQSEFSTYAPAGPLDMVDLSTGNFRLNIPVLEVPGPEGSFELPLHYRAGIGLNQEASWVGLGWSLNAGAITRMVNQFPDDANGEPLVLINKNPGRRGWSSNLGVLNLGWDSQTGHQGNVDIGVASANWQHGLRGASVAGLGYQQGEGLKINPLQTINAALTIASAGTAGTLSKALGVAGKAAATGVDVGFSAVVGATVAQAIGNVTGPSSKAGGYNRVTQRFEKHGGLFTNYWIFIDNSSTQKMYGPLYFQNLGAGANSGAVERGYGPNLYKGSAAAGKAGVFYSSEQNSTTGTSYRQEVSADVSLPVKPFDPYEKNNMRPLSVTYDNFTVSGPGVSGNIRPYRLDVGSVAFPRQMNDEHFKYNLVPFAQQRAEFIYEGSASNTYEHPQGTGANQGHLGISQQWQDKGNLILDDKLLYDGATRVQPDRYGLKGGRLAQGRQVEYFTNAEIIGQAGSPTPAAQGKFLDFAAPVSKTVRQGKIVGYTTTPCGAQVSCDTPPEPIYEYTDVTVPNEFRAGLPAQGVGAFVITAEDGTRYHFTLPVYHYKQFSKSWNLGKPEEYTSEKMGYNNSPYAYATAWLLTAITGPDFVDKGVKGVLDDADEGRWVKFEYGRFSSQFKWRAPYQGNATVDNGYATLPDGKPAPTYEAYSEGYKETYYLNSISTRSHTALFIKDVRQDGRGHYSGSTTFNSDLGISEKEPASSLKLSEIVLLTNEDYQQLKTAYGFGTNTANNAATRNAAQLAAPDSFDKVFDTGDLTANANALAYLRRQQLKRLQFHYSYRLCPGTDNSFASAKAAPAPGADACQRRGKLTLESFSTLGANDARLIPDFKFEYGYNPTYNAEKYDAYGFYKRERTRQGDDLFVNQGTAAVNTEGQSQASEDGSAWSLKRLRNPLGSVMEVSYERDQYSTVSGIFSSAIELQSDNSTLSNGILRTDPSSKFDLTTWYKVGQDIELKGNFIGKFWVESNDPNDTYQEYNTCSYPYTGKHRILEVYAHSIKIANPPTLETNPAPCINSSPTIHADFVEYQGFSAQFSVPKDINGGDIRVARISIQVENNAPQQTRYSYINTKFGTGFNSTGVISKEPEKASTTTVTNSALLNPEYPATPVIYGEVTELRGTFRNAAGQPDDQAIDVRTVYGFYTPTLDMISQTKTDVTELTDNVADYPNYKGTNFMYRVGLSMANNLTQVNTALIGQPRWVRSFDKRGVQEQETTYNYANDISNDANLPHQGYFAEGTLLSEMIKLTGTVKTDHDESRWFSLNKSVKTVVPTYLVGTTTNAGGIRNESKTVRYDFLSAAPLVTEAVNALGLRFRSEQTPAYKLAAYANMGPLVLAAGNKHMLSQTAATSVSKVLADGTLAPLGAAATTWQRTWTTDRTFSATQKQYAEATAPDPVWRLQRSFAWQGRKLNPDGTLAGFVPFSWGNPTAAGQNAGWVQQAEITHYDRYSRPLQTQDINGLPAAEKAGYGQQYTLTGAANARYVEMAYSGAEDQVPAGAETHFGGEVQDGGRQSADQHHTGAYSSLLAAGQTGFTYRAPVGNTSGVRTDRTYRASVWVYDNAAAPGLRLYFALNGTTVQEIGVADATTKRAGNWLLLNLYAKLAGADGGKQLTVGCRNAGTGAAYADDFRFHPVDAPLTASVYDPHTKQVTYALDNDNLYTQYEYDAAGKPVRVFQEVLTPPGSAPGAERRRVQESAYNYAHLRDANWVPTDNVRYQTTSSGSVNPAAQEAEERDANTASATYGQTRWIAATTAPTCVTCQGNDRYIKGRCESPLIDCVSSVRQTDGKYKNTYEYRYSDGSTIDPVTKLESAPCTL